MIGLREIAELPSWFRQTKAGAEMLAEAEAQVSAQRKHHVEVLRVNQTAAEKELPKLANATADAKEKYRAAQEAVVAALREFQQAELAELSANHRIQTAVSQSRGYLHDSAPQCVRDYLGELLKYYGDIRRSSVTLPDIKGAEVPGNATAGHEQRKALNVRWQHTLVVREYHQLVRQTIEDVKAMFLTAVDVKQAEKEIAKYRAAIAKAEKAAGILLERR